MFRLTKSFAFAGAVLLVACFLQEGSAHACNQVCKKILSGGPFCYQCWYTGEYTGQTCEDSGPCGCYYTQNTCGLRAAAKTPGASTDSIFAATEAEPRLSAAPASTPALASSFLDTAQ